MRFSMQAPPPPPSVKRASLELFVRREIRPRVEAICEGGLEGREHQTICLAVATTLSKWQPVYGAGVVAPFCERICWHSCNGESHVGGLEDGFVTCPSEGCAQSSCLDFLQRECPPVQGKTIESLYDKACTAAPPSPPAPPNPPPLPPSPPLPSRPPPAIEYTLRERDAETDANGDCQLVSHSECKQIVSDYATRNGVRDAMETSFAPCEGLSDEPDCFVVRSLPLNPWTTHAPTRLHQARCCCSRRVVSLEESMAGATGFCCQTWRRSLGPSTPSVAAPPRCPFVLVPTRLPRRRFRSHLRRQQPTPSRITRRAITRRARR